MPSTYDSSDDLTPSERLVLHVLEHGAGRVPQSEVIDRAGLPRRTARDAFSRLDERGRIDRRPDPDDPRRNIVELAETVST